MAVVQFKIGVQRSQGMNSDQSPLCFVQKGKMA